MTMLENVIRNVTASAVDNTIVVLGADRDMLIPFVIKSSIRYCINDNYKEGMLSSVKCAMTALPDNMDAVLVFQGDQPFIPSYVINKLIDNYKASGKGIIIPVFDGRRGHPVLIGNKLINEVTKLDPGKGLRSLAYTFPDEVLEVETDNQGILRDIDTYEDYLIEINKLH
jgi:molybdenum cofactor cytidylyltransferase